MALPSTISGAWSAFKNATHGPFADGTNRYVITIRADGATRYASIYKSTDGGNTWVQKDSANDPSLNTTAANLSISADYESGKIYVLHLNAAATQLVVKPFTCSSDTWGTATAASGNTPEALHDSGQNAFCLAAIADGDYICAYQYTGGGGEEVAFKRYSGGSWGSATTVRAGDTALFAILKESTTRVHFVYTLAPDDLLTRAWTTALGLRPAASVDSTMLAAGNYRVGIPGVSSTELLIGYIDAGGEIDMARATPADTPTWAHANVTAAGTAPEYTNANPGVVVVAASQELFYLWGDDATQDVYYDHDAGTGTWGTDTEFADAVTCNGINARAIGSVAGILYDNAGTVTYDELTIGGTTHQGAATASQGQTATTVGRRRARGIATASQGQSATTVGRVPIDVSGGIAITGYDYHAIFGTLTKSSDSNRDATISAEVSTDEESSYLTANTAVLLEQTATTYKFAITRANNAPLASHTNSAPTYTHVRLTIIHADGVNGTNPITKTGPWTLKAWPSRARPLIDRRGVRRVHFNNSPDGTSNPEFTDALAASMDHDMVTPDESDPEGGTWRTTLYGLEPNRTISGFSTAFQISHNLSDPVTINGNSYSNGLHVGHARNEWLKNLPGAMAEALHTLFYDECTESAFLHDPGDTFDEAGRASATNSDADRWLMDPGDAGYQSFCLKAALIEERENMANTTAASIYSYHPHWDNVDFRHRVAVANLPAPGTQNSDEYPTDPTTGPQPAYRAASVSWLQNMGNHGVYRSGNLTRVTYPTDTDEWADAIANMDMILLEAALKNFSSGTVENWKSSADWWTHIQQIRTALGDSAAISFVPVAQTVEVAGSPGVSNATLFTDQPETETAFAFAVASVWMIVTSRAQLDRLFLRITSRYRRLRVPTQYFDLDIGQITTAGRQLGATGIWRVDGASGYIEVNPDTAAHTATGGSGTTLDPHESLFVTYVSESPRSPQFAYRYLLSR